MRRLKSAVELIASKNTAPQTNEIVEVQGYTTPGDGGGAQWRFNGNTMQTASQSPAQLGDALLNDASGNQWSSSQVKVLATSLGITGDGVTDDTLAVQAAFNGAEGAYRLHFPRGRYLLTDSILIKSNTFVTADPGAVFVRGWSASNTGATALFRNDDFGSGNTNIAFIGGTFELDDPSYIGRIFGFEFCEYLYLMNGKIDGAQESWATSFKSCNKIWIDNYSIDTPAILFNDGLHFMCGQDIFVSNCYIASGDDCIAFNATNVGENADGRGLVVSNCVLRNRGSSCIKILHSTSSPYQIQGASFSNITMIADGGSRAVEIVEEDATRYVRDISFNNITIYATNATEDTVKLEKVTNFNAKNLNIIDSFKTPLRMIGENQGIRITGGKIDGTQSAATNLIVIEEGDDIQISSMELDGGTTHGIAVGTVGTVSDLTLSKVKISNCTTYGVSLSDSTDCKLERCRIKGNNRPVNVSANAINTDIIGNTFSGNTNDSPIMSGSGTVAKDNRGYTTELEGSVTLSSGTASVSFSSNMPSGSYVVTLSSSANETMRWSSRTASGFTITSSNGSSAATVTWSVSETI